MKKCTALTITICLILFSSFQVYAKTNSSQIKPDDVEWKEKTGLSFDYIQTKLKLSKSDIEKIKAERHGLEKYLLEKGWKREDIWALKKEAKFAAIDEKVKKGELTKEKGEEIKIKIENRKMKPRERKKTD